MTPTKRKSVCDQFDTQIREYAAAGETVSQTAADIGISRPTLVHYVRREQIVFESGHGNGTVTKPTKKETPTGEVSREEILDHRVKELESRLAKDRRATVAQERIIQAIELACATVTPSEMIETPWVDFGSGLAKEDAHHRQLLMLSDFHGGEVVDRAAVNGLNSYDWEIMEARVDEVVAGCVSHKDNSPALTGLDVVFGGDMCSGENHEELARTNQFPLAEQAIRMGYLEASIIERLQPHYPTIRVLSVEGNHPRFTVKPAAKMSHNNGDWIAAKVMEQHLARFDNVSVRVGSGAEFWEIAGQTFYVFHGDGVRSSMPGIPWGGIARRTNEIRRAHRGRQIDGFLAAHFHQANAMFDLGIYINGALKGTDEWVQKNFGGGAPPTQLLLEFDEKAERMTAVKKLTPTAGL